MNRALRLSGCRGPDGSKTTLAIEDGRFTDDPLGQASETVRLDDCVVLPGLIDCHLHLDKTLLGAPWQPHMAGNSVGERIDHERKRRRDISPGVIERGDALLSLALSQGTTFVRSHVDIDDDIGLENLVAVLELRQRWKPTVEIQIVAFPQSGILRSKGVQDLLDEALKMGADLVGGLDPHTIDGDREGHLRVIFDLAVRHAKGIDIHLHEPGGEGLRSLELICEMTRAHGLAGLVTVSHAFCLGTLDENGIQRMAAALAGSGVGTVTSAPGAFPMPPIAQLRAWGVRVGAGSDNVRDLWSPFGNASMLERCMLVAYRSGWRTDDLLMKSLELATSGAADLVGRQSYGLMSGCAATCAVFPVPSVALAIVERPKPILVLVNGRAVLDPGGLIKARQTDPVRV